MTNRNAAALGRLGGKVRSEAKAAACKANARRPRPSRCKVGGRSAAEWRRLGL